MTHNQAVFVLLYQTWSWSWLEPSLNMIYLNDSCDGIRVDRFLIQVNPLQLNPRAFLFLPSFFLFLWLLFFFLLFFAFLRLRQKNEIWTFNLSSIADSRDNFFLFSIKIKTWWAVDLPRWKRNCRASIFRNATFLYPSKCYVISRCLKVLSASKLAHQTNSVTKKSYLTTKQLDALNCSAALARQRCGPPKVKLDDSG